MINNVYIEFGVGNNFRYVREHALKNYYTIVIDKKFGLFNNYDKAFSENEHFVDKRIIGDWNNDYDIPKANKWSCVSCFEHIMEDMIDKSIEGIIKKIKKEGKGYIYVDLTDHHGGFKHYRPESYRKGYINTIKADQWKLIFSKYFTFDYEKRYLENIKEYPRAINLSNVRLKL